MKARPNSHGGPGLMKSVARDDSIRSISTRISLSAWETASIVDICHRIGCTDKVKAFMLEYESLTKHLSRLLRKRQAYLRVIWDAFHMLEFEIRSNNTQNISLDRHKFDIREEIAQLAVTTTKLLFVVCSLRKMQYTPHPIYVSDNGDMIQNGETKGENKQKSIQEVLRGDARALYEIIDATTRRGQSGYLLESIPAVQLIPILFDHAAVYCNHSQSSARDDIFSASNQQFMQSCLAVLRAEDQVLSSWLTFSAICDVAESNPNIPSISDPFSSSPSSIPTSHPFDHLPLLRLPYKDTDQSNLVDWFEALQVSVYNKAKKLLLDEMKSGELSNHISRGKSKKHDFEGTFQGDNYHSPSKSMLPIILQQQQQQQQQQQRQIDELIHMQREQHQMFIDGFKYMNLSSPITSEIGSPSRSPYTILSSPFHSETSHALNSAPHDQRRPHSAIVSSSTSPYSPPSSPFFSSNYTFSPTQSPNPRGHASLHPHSDGPSMKHLGGDNGHQRDATLLNENDVLRLENHSSSPAHAATVRPHSSRRIPTSKSKMRMDSKAHGARPQSAPSNRGKVKLSPLSPLFKYSPVPSASRDISPFTPPTSPLPSSSSPLPLSPDDKASILEQYGHHHNIEYDHVHDEGNANEDDLDMLHFAALSIQVWIRGILPRRRYLQKKMSLKAVRSILSDIISASVLRGLLNDELRRAGVPVPSGGFGNTSTTETSNLTSNSFLILTSTGASSATITDTQSTINSKQTSKVAFESIVTQTKRVPTLPRGVEPHSHFQSSVRGKTFQALSNEDKICYAATNIQRMIRGFLARCFAYKLIVKAIKVQRAWRRRCSLRSIKESVRRVPRPMKIVLEELNNLPCNIVFENTDLEVKVSVYLHSQLHVLSPADMEAFLLSQKPTIVHTCPNIFKVTKDERKRVMKNGVEVISSIAPPKFTKQKSGQVNSLTTSMRNLSKQTAVASHTISKSGREFLANFGILDEPAGPPLQTNPNIKNMCSFDGEEINLPGVHGCASILFEVWDVVEKHKLLSFFQTLKYESGNAFIYWGGEYAKESKLLLAGNQRKQVNNTSAAMIDKTLNANLSNASNFIRVRDKDREGTSSKRGVDPVFKYSIEVGAPHCSRCENARISYSGKGKYSSMLKQQKGWVKGWLPVYLSINTDGLRVFSDRRSTTSIIFIEDVDMTGLDVEITGTRTNGKKNVEDNANLILNVAGRKESIKLRFDSGKSRWYWTEVINNIIGERGGMQEDTKFIEMVKHLGKSIVEEAAHRRHSIFEAIRRTSSISTRPKSPTIIDSQRANASTSDSTGSVSLPAPGHTNLVHKFNVDKSSGRPILKPVMEE